MTSLLCLQMGIYFEARSESLIGQSLVAETILNRVKSPKFPNNICDVVIQRKQFSFFNDASSDNPLIIKDKKSWNAVGYTAKRMIQGNISYGTGCFYHTIKVKPSWAKKMNVLYIEDNHIFYTNC